MAAALVSMALPAGAPAAAWTSPTLSGSWAPTDPVPAPLPAREPTLTTSAWDGADRDRMLYAAGGQIVDTVTYRGLSPGRRYTVRGDLFDRASGLPTGITATVSVTPVSAEGTAVVRFTVPASHVGTAYVAFAHLYGGSGVLVARHADITDAAQTVRVSAAPPGRAAGADPFPDPGAALTPTAAASPTVPTAAAAPAAPAASAAAPAAQASPAAPEPPGPSNSAAVLVPLAVAALFLTLGGRRLMTARHARGEYRPRHGAPR